MRFLFLLLLTTTALSQSPNDGFICLQGGEYPLGEENVPIELSPFCIAPTEVTFGQMALYCYENNLDPLDFHYEGWGDPQSSRAAVQVNWYDAIRYCNWLSGKVGLQPAYKIYGEGDKELNPYITADSSIYWNKDAEGWAKIDTNFANGGYRLPTEAEWEYAASSYEKLKTKQYYSGCNTYDSLVQFAWYGNNAQSRARNVKTRLPNPLGIYDMSGNVLEWCFDIYGADFNDFKNIKNPLYYKKEDISSDRLLRGGSWGNSEEFCRVQRRSSDAPLYESSGGGFRLARTKQR